MKIFPTQSIKELDAYTIENEPIASIDLMERASQALTKAIMKRWEAETPITVFAGPGNNGGDALAVSRLLAEKGYQVSLYLFNTKGELSPDCEANKERLADVKNVDFHEVTSQFVPPVLTVDHVVIDGLFGSGLNKPLSGGFAAVVKYINASSAQIVAIDVPSGLMGEENTFNIKANIVRADVTLSLQLPKLAFLFAENQEFVGEWELLDIGLSEDAIEEMATDYSLLEAEDMQDLLKPRNKFAHKGDFGRALLIAGSQGMAGASVLAAKACLRSGVGLLTAPLRARFGINLHLEYYDDDVLTSIIRRSANILNVPCDMKAAGEIASRSRGTPRIANALLRRVRDFAQVKGSGRIDVEIARFALEALNIDRYGLDEIDNKILCTIIDKFKGGPVGLTTIATALGEDAGTIEEVYEPFLIKEGFLKRTPRGREVTELAYIHLGRSIYNSQKTLFDD